MHPSYLQLIQKRCDMPLSSAENEHLEQYLQANPFAATFTEQLSSVLQIAAEIDLTDELVPPQSDGLCNKITAACAQRSSLNQWLSMFRSAFKRASNRADELAWQNSETGRLKAIAEKFAARPQSTSDTAADPIGQWRLMQSKAVFETPSEPLNLAQAITVQVRNAPTLSASKEKLPHQTNPVENSPASSEQIDKPKAVHERQEVRCEEGPWGKAISERCNNNDNNNRIKQNSAHSMNEDSLFGDATDEELIWWEAGIELGINKDSGIHSLNHTVPACHQPFPAVTQNAAEKNANTHVPTVLDTTTAADAYINSLASFETTLPVQEILHRLDELMPTSSTCDENAWAIPCNQTDDDAAPHCLHISIAQNVPSYSPMLPVADIMQRLDELMPSSDHCSSSASTRPGATDQAENAPKLTPIPRKYRPIESHHLPPSSERKGGIHPAHFCRLKSLSAKSPFDAVGKISDLGRFIVDDLVRQSISRISQTSSKERIFTLEAAMSATQLLKQLEGMEGVQGSLVLGTDGTPIISTLEDRFELDILGPCVLGSYLTTYNLLKQIGCSASHMIFRTDSGYHMITDMNDALLLTVTDFQNPSELDRLYLEVRRITE